MNVIDELAKAAPGQETILTIGAFDAVHLGHQALIEQVVARARAMGRRAALVTFHPRPAVVLAPDRAPRSLTSPREKVALLEELGVDLVVLLKFDRQMAAMPASTFMTSLSRHLQAKEIWVGSDFALGRDREGDLNRLRELGQELGYSLHVFEPVCVDGQIVSSSRIRDLLREGRVEEASRLLGRCPSLSGKVVRGAGRGRNLGFPTANLEVLAGRVVPASGVYAVYALLGADWQPGVANIGVRPSFDGSSLSPTLRTIEIHLFDFHRDIYGCDLLVEFVARLRSERRFDDIQDLIAQIEQDSQQARQILAESVCTLPVWAAWLSAEASQDASEVNGDPPQSDIRSDQPVCDFRCEEVEHTADRALRIWARDLTNLFVGAAQGMYSLMADIDGLVATTWRQINLEEWDLESLLVSWLNELLFLTETQGLLFIEFRFESLTDETLVAHVGGVPGSATRAGIKAATFHDLRLLREAGEWTTTLTFDV